MEKGVEVHAKGGSGGALEIASEKGQRKWFSCRWGEAMMSNCNATFMTMHSRPLLLRVIRKLCGYCWRVGPIFKDEAAVMTQFFRLLVPKAAIILSVNFWIWVPTSMSKAAIMAILFKLLLPAATRIWCSCC